MDNVPPPTEVTGVKSKSAHLWQWLNLIFVVTVLRHGFVLYLFFITHSIRLTQPLFSLFSSKDCERPCCASDEAFVIENFTLHETKSSALLNHF